MKAWGLLPTCLVIISHLQSTVDGTPLYKIAGLNKAGDEEAVSLEARLSNFNFQFLRNIAKARKNARTSPPSQVDLTSETVRFELPLERGETRVVDAHVRSVEPVEGEDDTYRVYGTIPSWNATAPGDDATFTMYVDGQSKTVQGNVMAGREFWALDSDGGEMKVAKYDQSRWVCTLPVLGATPEEPSARRLHSEAHGHDCHGHESTSRHDLDSAHRHPGSERRPAKRQLHTTSGKGAHRRLAPSRGMLIFVDIDPLQSKAGLGLWGAISFLLPCGSSPEGATDINAWMDVVRNDFAPFNVTVTSNRTDYTTWPATWGPRVRVAMAEVASMARLGRNQTIGVSICGVAFLGSLRQRDNVVWASCRIPACGTARPIGQTISHEVGHTFGLRHDGSRTDGEYLRGLPSKLTTPSWPLEKRWNPIMGSPLLEGVVQWSRGEYANYTLGRIPNARQDDLAIIGRSLAPKPGAGCNRAFLPIHDFNTVASKTWDQTVITCGGGNDTYFIRFFGDGAYSVTVNTVPNTDLKFQVSIESGTSLTTIPGRLRRPTTYKLEGATLLQQQVSDLYSPAPVTLSGGASSGLHRVVIKSIGQEESSPTAGHMFTAYGSVGAYTLSITPPIPAASAAIVDLLAGADPEATSRVFSKRMWKKDDEPERSEASAKRPTRAPK